MYQKSILINHATEEVKDESIMHRTVPRETPHQFYQQSEFTEKINNNNDDEESK